MFVWVFMPEQPHTNLTSPCAKPSVGWSGVKLTGLWSSEDVFSGVMITLDHLAF
jgi:hypothetical protein